MLAKHIATFLRGRMPGDTLHTMQVLMRSYYDQDSAEEVAEALVDVLYCRFKVSTPKKAALENLRKIGPVGIDELERALKCRLRRADPRLRIQAIATLAEARVPSSWKVLVAMGRDSNQAVAIAAVKALAQFTHIPPRELPCMVTRLAGLMRPPTAEERRKDLDLPPLQKTVRQVLTQITGAQIHQVAKWKVFLRKWVREGCPVAKSPNKKDEKKMKTEVSASHRNN